MKNLFILSCLTVILAFSIFPLALSAQNQGDFLVLQNRITELYKEHRSALVRVKAVHASEATGDDVPQLVIGTGFFISREGLILTNASIVDQPVRVWVEHNGISYSCDVVGVDGPTNLALLRIHSLPRQFSFFHLADAAEPPPIGSFVMRLSKPLEFDVTPDLGLITGIEGRFGNRFFPCNFVRTNIAAGPGDGGAAYVDLSGRLLGIQVGSLPELRATYMLPARAALRIRDDLLFSGEVRYGWIGFEVREESSIITGPSLIINAVIPGTPAQTAGMLPGDTIVRIGQYAIRTVDDLRNAMFYNRVDQFVRVVLRRSGQDLDFNVRLAPRPKDEPLEVVRPMLSDSPDIIDPVVPSPPREPLIAPLPNNGE